MKLTKSILRETPVHQELKIQAKNCTWEKMPYSYWKRFRKIEEKKLICKLVPSLKINFMLIWLKKKTHKMAKENIGESFSNNRQTYLFKN